MTITAAGIKAKNKYNKQAYSRFAVFTDKGSAARIRVAAEVAGESINSFIINGALNRIQGSPTPKIQLADTDGAEQLMSAYEKALNEYHAAIEKEQEARLNLEKKAGDLLAVLKNSI